MDAARGARGAFVQGRKEASEGFYEAAKSGTADVQPLVDFLDDEAEQMSGTATGKALEKARNALTVPGPEGRMPKESIGYLHDAKMEIDSLIESAKTKRANSRVAKLQNVKEQLLTAMEDAEGSYRMGRETFRDMSPPINEYDASVIGRVAAREDDPKLRLGKLLFKSENTSPEQVAYAREMIASQDPESWGGLVRGHIQAELENMKESSIDEISNLAGRVRKKLFGTKRQMRVWREALTEDQYENLKDLDTLFRAISRTSKGQSITAQRQEMNRQLKDEAKPALSMLANPFAIPGRLSGMWEEKRYQKAVAKIAELITSPVPEDRAALDAVVRKLRRYSPDEWHKNSDAIRAVAVGATILTGSELAE